MHFQPLQVSPGGLFALIIFFIFRYATNLNVNYVLCYNRKLLYHEQAKLHFSMEHLKLHQ